jgi:hypothetical protein
LRSSSVSTNKTMVSYCTYTFTLCFIVRLGGACLLSVGLTQIFDFTPSILYIHPSCVASARLNLIIPIAPHTSLASSAPYNCILYLSNPNVLYKHRWLLDISRVLYNILSACDTDELTYTCAPVSFKLPPLHWHFNQGVNHSSTSTYNAYSKAHAHCIVLHYWVSTNSGRLSLQPRRACYI